MKTPKGKEVFVFDNEGRSYDRFTIVTRSDGAIYGASCDPFSPLGFGQFCGQVSDPSYNTTVAQYIKDAQDEVSWLGKEITVFSELPEDVQKYVEQVSE